MALPIPPSEPPIRLEPASLFPLEALTAAYNQGRADYLIPMQMDPAHLAAYMRVYDVDLEHSWVALEGERVLGLAMLGVRPGRTWVTRLGVLPSQRRSGAGEALMRALLRSTRALGCSRSILEVIQGNAPAHRLFQRVGFRATRLLLVLRRPPGPVDAAPSGSAEWLDGPAALDLLSTHPAPLAWTNQPESYANGGDAQALRVEGGWLVFRRQAGQLSHFIFHTAQGSPERAAQELAAHLYARYPRLETRAENLPADDPHLPALLRLGFQEAFRRVEMHWTAGAEETLSA